MNVVKLKLSMFIVIVFLVSLSNAVQADSKIGYVRPNAPELKPFIYDGFSYEDLVPDTIDLAERAKLAVNCLTSVTDPNSDYDIYFWLHVYSGPDHNAPFRNPPAIRRDFSSLCHMKFAEALPLMRIMSGSSQNKIIDNVWMNSTAKSIGDDGLYYWPLIGRDWFREGSCWMSTGIWGSDGKSKIISDPNVAQISHPLSGRYISAMTIYYLLDKNSLWKQTIEKMIDRWSEIAIHKGDYCYFPSAGYQPNAKMPRDLPEPLHIDGEENNSRLIQALAQYYKISNYEPAKKLAKKLINYIRYQMKWFDGHGRFIDENPNNFEVDFFHAYTITLLGFMEYAEAVNDAELSDFVNKSFQYGINQKLSPSSTLVGWFPENVRTGYPSSELCCIADMIALALKLTNTGKYDYWDEIDRWTRNQFIEGQLLTSQWVYDNAAKSPKTELKETESADKAVERNIGGFAGWATPNEWSIRNGIMHCCTGNSARTIYYVWNNIIDCQDDKLIVNLLMNRASQWADLHSHIPYEGKIDIKLKKKFAAVSVRIPQWIDPNRDSIKCQLDGKDKKFIIEGRYVKISKVKKGQTVALEFPISERTVKENVGGVDYTFKIKGNDVVDVKPDGKYNPLYQRYAYRDNTTKWIKVKRFISKETIKW